MSILGIDNKAFRSLHCGVYLVSSKNNTLAAGCIINTFQQVTSSPARVSIAINKENATTGIILDAGKFEVSVLAEDTPMELIGRFGFHTSTEIDKFENTHYATDKLGIPYVTEHAVAHFGARVIDTIDAGTHYLILGEVECAEVLSTEPPLTYAYYHLIKGGKTPPKASSYDPTDIAPESNIAPTISNASIKAADKPAKETASRYGWRCKICGYIVEADELPDDFTCPICGVGRDMFERIEL